MVYLLKSQKKYHGMTGVYHFFGTLRTRWPRKGFLAQHGDKVKHGEARFNGGDFTWIFHDDIMGFIRNIQKSFVVLYHSEPKSEHKGGISFT